jgi:AraC-like DNA-binding protein
MRDTGEMATAVVLTRWETDLSVHETAVRAAEGVARKAVRGYVGYEEWPADQMTRREVARCGVALILGFGDPLATRAEFDGPVQSLSAFVVGNQSHASLTEIGGHQNGVQVELSSAGALSLFGQVGQLNNAVIPQDEVLGGWGKRLVEQMGNAATWEERFTLLDHAFGGLEPVVGMGTGTAISPEVSWLCHQLTISGGQARVEPLMDETGWSRRFVTERFRTQLGVSPKAYARILRFRSAVALLDEVGHGRTLADVAMDCGYYDQSHFTRDFVALAGCTPSVFMAETDGDPGVRFLQDNELLGPLP